MKLLKLIEAINKPTLSRRDAIEIVREIETGRGGIGDLAKRKPGIATLSQDNLRAKFGDTVPLFRVLGIPEDKEFRPETIVSTTTNWEVARAMGNSQPGVIMSPDKFTSINMVLVRYDTPVSQCLADVNMLLEMVVGQFGGYEAIGNKGIKGRRSGETVPISLIIEEGLKEEEVIADVTGLEPTVVLKFKSHINGRREVDMIHGIANNKYSSSDEYLHHRKNDKYSSEFIPPDEEQSVRDVYDQRAPNIKRFLGMESAEDLSEGFDTTQTGMPTFDDMLKDPEYFRTAKRKVFNIVNMTPNEYIDKAVYGFNKFAGERNVTRHTLMRSRDPKVIDQYGAAMQRGDKFPMPVLDYTRGDFSQEGLHRAAAALRVGLNQMPVMVVVDAEPVNEADEIVNIGDRIEQKKLNTLHGEFMSKVADRTAQKQKQVDAHEWSVQVGDKVQTEHGQRMKQPPLEVVGRTIKKKGLDPSSDPKNGKFIYTTDVPYIYYKSQDGVTGTIPEWAVITKFGGPRKLKSVGVNEADYTESGDKFYHVSNDALRDGTILTPTGKTWSVADKILEQYRPQGALSRQESVYMFPQFSDAEFVGIEGHYGIEGYLYEVEPMGGQQWHHVHWYAQVVRETGEYNMGSRFNSEEEYKTLIQELASNYWNGAEFGEDGWEVAAPQARIIRYLGPAEDVLYENKLTEAPVRDFYVDDSIEAPDSNWSPRDVKVLSSLNIEELARKRIKTAVPIDMVFMNIDSNKESWTDEHGDMSSAFFSMLEDNSGVMTLGEYRGTFGHTLRVTPDGITAVFFSNTQDRDTKIGMTPWIMVHRMAHSLMDGASKNSNEARMSMRHLQELDEYMLTMKSARTDTMTNGEAPIEALSQFLHDGKITLARVAHVIDDDSVQLTNGREAMSGNAEYLNDVLEQIEERVNIAAQIIVNAAIGKVVVAP